MLVWEHPESDKLFCEEIDVGEEKPRQIASGLRKFMKIEQLQGASVLVVTNLKPAKLGGFPSAGMVLCAKQMDGENETVEFIRAPEGAKIGERVLLEGTEAGQHEPFLPNKVKKKKVLEHMKDVWKTDAGRQCTWEGKKWMTTAGPCFAENLANAVIS